jgi:hypothetical protein
MRWLIGSQPTIIKEHTCTLIQIGVGHLQKVQDRQATRDTTYPVYISEPLVIASLSGLFDNDAWSKRKEWFTNYLNLHTTKQGFGYAFEDAMLFVVMESFGGKYIALGDVFHFSDTSPLKSREVTLVSLMRMDDGEIFTSNVEWHSRSSPRLGFKAGNHEDVVRFFTNPCGITFLFPDTRMGPDLIFFVKDKETGELMMVVVQIKATLNVSWLVALQSITPDFFYSMIVRVSFLITYCRTDILMQCM